MQAAGGVENYGVRAVGKGLLFEALAELGNVLFVVVGINVDAYLLAEGFELVDCRRAIDVASN